MVNEWFADEAFWEASYPFMFGEQQIVEAPREAESIIALTGVRSGALLDVACGPGRHATAFAAAGFQVTGIDRSPFLLAKARERERSNGAATIEWVLSDMRTFVRPRAFDLAICLYTSFGFFDEHEHNRLVLEVTRDNLRPGGKLVLDVMGKETLANIYEPTGSRKLAGVGTAFMRRAFLHSYSRVENEWTLVSERGDVRRFTFQHWVYSARELELMFQESGFARVDIFGGFDGRPYAPGASRLIVIASTPA